MGGPCGEGAAEGPTWAENVRTIVFTSLFRTLEGREWGENGQRKTYLSWRGDGYRQAELPTDNSAFPRCLHPVHRAGSGADHFIAVASDP